MASRKMLILRGNGTDKAGTYPDELGNKPAWPKGALHETAAKDYATSRGYEGVVVDEKGQPQNQDSPQANAAVDAFHADQSVCAFYGFSGGGFNLYHILKRLASREPQSLHRIELIVVLGAPERKKWEFMPANFNGDIGKKDKSWTDAKWEVVYRTNPKAWQMPKGLPKGLDTHMFGPDVLLAGWKEDA
jgi:hypothetical protein